jgi:hypothetical protein
MKASKFSEAQISFVLKQAEGDATIAECIAPRFLDTLRVQYSLLFKVCW